MQPDSDHQSSVKLNKNLNLCMYNIDTINVPILIMACKYNKP